MKLVPLVKCKTDFSSEGIALAKSVVNSSL